MKLATQTYIPTKMLGFENGIRAIKKAGFDSVDLSLFRMDQDDNEYVKEDWKAIANEERAILNDIGIACTQAHAPHIFDFGNDNILKNVAIPRIERSIEIASIMGASCVVVHPLHHLDYRTNRDEIRNMNLQYMSNFIPKAQDFGIVIGYENMWQRDLQHNGIVASTGGIAIDLAEDIDAIDSPYVKACLDVGHSSLVGQEAQDAIQILGRDRIIALHVSDNDYISDQHTLPFLGKMNWKAIMHSLYQIGYEGDFTYEADNFLRGMDVDLLQPALTFMEIVGRKIVDGYLC